MSGERIPSLDLAVLKRAAFEYRASAERAGIRREA